MENINARFLEAMEYVGISAYYVAKSAGIAESTMSNIKSGKNRPSTELLEWLLNNYEALSADYIMRGRGTVATLPIEEKIDAMIMQLGEMRQEIKIQPGTYKHSAMQRVPKRVPKRVPNTKTKD